MARACGAEEILLRLIALLSDYPSGYLYSTGGMGDVKIAGLRFVRRRKNHQYEVRNAV